MEITKEAIFPYSHINPVVSPTSKYIAYVDHTDLIILEASTLEITSTVHLLPRNSTAEITVTQIQWVPVHEGKSSKLAVLIDTLCEILIFDVKDPLLRIKIKEDDILGLERFDWVPSPSMVLAECNHIMIFSKDSICAKLISLDGQIHEFLKPETTHITTRADGISSLVLRKSNFESVVQYIGLAGSSTPLLYETKLGSYINLEQIKYSPNSHWVLTNETGKNGIDIKLYPVIQPSSEPLLQYISADDPLGAIQAEFLFYNESSSYDILFSDHFEIIRRIRMSNDLTQIAKYKHTRSVPDSSLIYLRNARNNTYIRKSNPYELPQIENPSLQLHQQGFLKFIIHGEKLISVPNSIPSVVFVWNLNDDVLKSPLESVIMTASKIKNFEIFEDLLIITNADSITLYKENNIPVTLNHETIIKSVTPLKLRPFTLLITEQSTRTFKVVRLNTPFTDPDAPETTAVNVESTEEGMSTIFMNDVLKTNNLQKVRSRVNASYLEEDTFVRRKRPRESLD